MIVELPIANGFYRSESLPVSAQQGINCYPVIAQAPSLVQEYVVGCPGIEQKALITGGGKFGRGVHVMGGVFYCVNGTTLYRVNSDYSYTSLGTITGSSNVSMADNGTQLLILVPGSTGYIFTEAPDTLTTITDPDFTANGNPQYVVFVDGYFLLSTDQKKFIVSALNDGLSYNALDFGSAESDPDAVTCPAIYQNQVFIFGTTTIEVEQNVGGSGFPFQRSGLFFDKGTTAPLSVIPAIDRLIFVGNGVNESPAVWAINGNAVEKLSTNSIDTLLQDLTTQEVAAIRSWTYAQKGSYFVGFSLPTTTIVYDSMSKRWHERQSLINGEIDQYRVHSMATAYGKVLCNDVIDGRIGSLDPAVFSEYDELIVKKIVTMPFADKMLSLFVPMIELTVESGVGNSDATDPVVELERSVDGGRTWSYSRARTMGEIGQYQKRAIWRRNGRAARYECFRFTHAEKSKFVAIQLRADLIEGRK